MKKGYWVVAYRSISDESAVKAYGQLAVPALESFGGRLLTKSTSQVQVHEAGLQQRAVLVEFDSHEIALQPMKASCTKRRFRHSAPARNGTSASSKVREIFPGWWGRVF